MLELTLRFSDHYLAYNYDPKTGLGNHMPKTPILYLIKDFVDHKVVLYWSDDHGTIVSPMFTSIQSAEEWWLKYNYSLYTGPERRKSFVDRRRLHSQRTREERSRHIPSPKPEGRRYTDIEIKIDKDISRVKILQFYSMNPHLLNQDDT